jgi:hypothetical protein
MADVTFEQVKALIEQLPSEELERLRAYLNSVAEGKQSDPVTTTTSSTDANIGTWGQRLVAIVEQFNFEADDQWKTDDPEEWVREYRRKQSSRRNEGWGAE